MPWVEDKLICWFPTLPIHRVLIICYLARQTVLLHLHELRNSPASLLYLHHLLLLSSTTHPLLTLNPWSLQKLATRPQHTNSKSCPKGNMSKSWKRERTLVSENASFKHECSGWGVHIQVLSPLAVGLNRRETDIQQRKAGGSGGGPNPHKITARRPWQGLSSASPSPKRHPSRRYQALPFMKFWFWKWALWKENSLQDNCNRAQYCEERVRLSSSLPYIQFQ